MGLIDINRASQDFNERLTTRFSKAQSTTSGFVISVDNDTAGRHSVASVQLTGGPVVKSQVPYGTNVYPGLSVSMVNDGSPSMAIWRITGSSSFSPIYSGGRAISQGGTILDFYQIELENGGYIKAGGDALGSGPNMVLDEFGLYAYTVTRDDAYIALATVPGYGNKQGDVFFGSRLDGKVNFVISPEDGELVISTGSSPFLTVNGSTGNRLEDYLRIGPSTGPQIGLGSILGVAEIAMRDTQNRYVFLVHSDPMRVQIGATGDTEYILWEDGQLIVNGIIIASRITAELGTLGGFTDSSDGFTSPDGAMQLVSSGGINLDAIIAKYNEASVKWTKDDVSYLSIGTVVDLGDVTGNAIYSGPIPLRISGEHVRPSDRSGYSDSSPSRLATATPR